MRRALCWLPNWRPWTSSGQGSRRTAFSSSRSTGRSSRNSGSGRDRWGRGVLRSPVVSVGVYTRGPRFALPSNPVGGYLISDFVRSLRQETHKRGPKRRERRRSPTSLLARIICRRRGSPPGERSGRRFGSAGRNFAIFPLRPTASSPPRCRASAKEVLFG